MGNYDDVDSYKKKWGNIKYISYKKLKRMGEVLVIVYDGLAPFKVSKTIRTTVYEDVKNKKNPAIISVAFPFFRPRSYIVKNVIVENKNSYRGYIGEDIQKIAIKTLENKNTLIRAKAIARAAIKYFAARKIRECYINLAEHELYVGRFYYKMKKHRAAMGRYRYILENYPDLGQYHEALEFLSKCKAELNKEQENR